MTTSVTIRGSPLSVRLAALHLLRRRPALAVHLQVDPGRAWLYEGAIMMLDDGCPSWRATLAALVTREWPGFLTLSSHGRSDYAAGIGLVDPVQCEAELAEFEPWLLSAPVEGAAVLDVPALGEPLRASRVLESGFAGSLDRPVLFEASSAQGEFEQYLPLGPGSIMVRSFSCAKECHPVEAIFAGQNALMAQLAAFDHRLGKSLPTLDGARS